MPIILSSLVLYPISRVAELKLMNIIVKGSWNMPATYT